MDKIFAMQTFFFMISFFLYLFTIIGVAAYFVLKAKLSKRKLAKELKEFKGKEYEIITFDKNGYPVIVKYNGEYVIFK